MQVNIAPIEDAEDQFRVALTLHTTFAFIATRGEVSVSNIVRGMRSLLFLVLTALLSSAIFVVTLRPATSFAQDQPLQRKVKSKVPPEYPEIARKMSLTGVVRLEVTISANGSVKDTKVIGGHPILAAAAADAVKKWKFDPASAESTETVEFKFDPGN
jgi:TonB family protein